MAHLQHILVDLADGLKHGIYFSAGSHNGTLIRVHHVLNGVGARRLGAVDLGRQVQRVVALPDVGADHLQHPTLGLRSATMQQQRNNSKTAFQHPALGCGQS